MLKRLISVLVITASLGFAITGPNERVPSHPKSLAAPTNPAALPIPVADLFYTRSVGSPAWSPDSSQVVFVTTFTGRPNLWKVSANGGWPIQLVQSDNRQKDAAWSPDGKTIVFTSDYGGNEKWDIFTVPADGGPVKNLTNTPDISEDNILFSPDGSTLAFNYKPKTRASVDVAVMDMRAHQVRNLTNEKSPQHLWNVDVWSRDGRYVYASRGNIGSTDSSIFRVDVASGQAEELTPHTGEVIFSTADISPDGRTLLVSSDQKGGYQNVALLDVATKKLTWITDTQWEATAGEFSPDGKSITYAINADGRTSVFLKPLNGPEKKIPMPEGLTVTSGRPHAFSPRGDRLLVLHQSSQRPPDLWVYELTTQKPRQLTYSAIASLSPSVLPPSQIVHYKSFDGKIISAFMWLPFNAKRDGSLPGIVWPHGGPTGQTEDTLNRYVAALASRGYAVIAPNPRGSTGYGKEFQKANYQDLGGGDLKDYVAGRQFLIDTGFVNPQKIGIVGGSYGGFMTLMAIGKTPQLWNAAVDIFGVINWMTMLQNSDPLLQSYEKSLLGDPDKDRAVYENTSPLKYLPNANAPLLVLQGENDIRVPKNESEQAVEIYRRGGKTVEAKYYPEEGHGFARRENQIDSIQRMVDWFDKYLKAGTASD